MFSTQEYQYIKDLTENYYNKDYINYLCYTNNPSNSYNNQYYDIICYYSKKDITQNNNGYSIQSESVLCNIDTKNPTSTNKSNNSLTCSNYNGGTININNKEFIYSNVGNNSNIIQEYQSNLKYNEDFKLYSISIIMTLLLIFLYKFIITIIRR